jgi:hypothetical protein
MARPKASHPTKPAANSTPVAGKGSGGARKSIANSSPAVAKDTAHAIQTAANAAAKKGKTKSKVNKGAAPTALAVQAGSTPARAQVIRAAILPLNISIGLRPAKLLHCFANIASHSRRT